MFYSVSYLILLVHSFGVHVNSEKKATLLKGILD